MLREAFFFKDYRCGRESKRSEPQQCPPVTSFHMSQTTGRRRRPGRATFGPRCGSAARDRLFTKQANERKPLVRKNSRQRRHLRAWPAGHQVRRMTSWRRLSPSRSNAVVPQRTAFQSNGASRSFLSEMCIHPRCVTGFVRHFLKYLFQLPSSCSWFPVTAAELGRPWPWGGGGSIGLQVGGKAYSSGEEGATSSAFS